MLLGGGREGMDHHLWWCCCCCRDFTFFNDEWRKILYGLFFRIRYLQAVYLNGIINHNLCYGGDFLTNSDDFWFCLRFWWACVNSFKLGQKSAASCYINSPSLKITFQKLLHTLDPTLLEMWNTASRSIYHHHIHTTYLSYKKPIQNSQPKAKGCALKPFFIWQTTCLRYILQRFLLPAAAAHAHESLGSSRER